MLSEIRAQTNAVHDTTYVWIPEIQNRMVIGRGWGEGVKGLMWVKGYSISVVRRISSENPVYSMMTTVKDMVCILESCCK